MREVLIATASFVVLLTLFTHMEIVDHSEGRISMLEFAIAIAGSVTISMMFRFIMRASMADETEGKGLDSKDAINDSRST